MIGELTPPGAMSQALRAVLQDGAAPPALALLVLVGWIVARLGRHRTVVPMAVTTSARDARPPASRPGGAGRRRCGCSAPSPGPR